MVRTLHSHGKCRWFDPNSVLHFQATQSKPLTVALFVSSVRYTKVQNLPLFTHDEPAKMVTVTNECNSQLGSLPHAAPHCATQL
jgi:hypothetical protein